MILFFSFFRINNDELQRFYIAANGDLPNFLSAVKKTIRWRETYRILSAEELEMWTSMIYWHGLDVKGRPCLIIRLGMSCSLPAKDRPSFVQAVGMYFCFHSIWFSHCRCNHDIKQCSILSNISGQLHLFFMLYYFLKVKL